MTPDDYRAIALSLPEVVESTHMGHPDFRVGGKIFATLGSGPDWGVALLSPEAQAMFTEAEPKVFEPVPGGWGRRGSTRIRLAAVDPLTLRSVLLAAWRKAAPRGLVVALDALPPSPTT